MRPPLAVTLCLLLCAGIADAEVTVPAMDAGLNAAPATSQPPAPPSIELGAPERTASGERSCADDPELGEALLREADAALADRDLAAASARYEAIVSRCPETPAGRSAARVLMGLTAAGVGATHEVVAPQDGRVIYQLEPYSKSTRERLRLTTWERMDFGVTSFVYGLSVGYSFALAFQSPDPALALAPVVLSSAIYLLGAIGYLTLGDPDRADLPLVLAITSYVPTVVLLTGMVVTPRGAVSSSFGAGAAVLGLLAFPAAVVIAGAVELDPGDTQLVRDAGFWGGLLGFGVITGFAGDGSGGFYRPPDGQVLAAGALGGLVVGLSVGVLAASQTEFSLERIRVATWGGYGGALFGLLIGSAVPQGYSNGAPYKVATIGAAGGLALAFALSASLDELPRDAKFASRRPQLVPTLSSDGAPGLGLAGTF